MGFMEAAIDLKIATDPDTYWKNLEQGFINNSWDNTTQKATGLLRQYEIGSTIDTTYVGEKSMVPMEALHIPVIEMSPTAYYRSEDQAVQFLFKDITTISINGIYYYWKNNYWLSYYQYSNTTYQSYVTCVRCDNALKFRDPLDGLIYSWPCRINNEATMKNRVESKYLLTPSNIYTVEVQRNSQTERVFRLNRRFLIGGGGENDNLRSFRITGILNSHKDSITNNAGILYLTLELDELHEDDDLVNGIAANGDAHPIYTADKFTVTPKIRKIKLGIPKDITVTYPGVGIDIVVKFKDLTCGNVAEKENNVFTLYGALIGKDKGRLVMEAWYNLSSKRELLYTEEYPLDIVSKIG